MTQYYFDYAAGSDANSGLTTGSPKKTLQAARALALSGNILSFKRGVIWLKEGWSNAFELDLRNPASPCTLNDYGSAVSPPTIDLLDYETTATGWTHLGSGRWSKSWANQVDRVIFGGNAGALSVGGLSHATSTATTATRQWYWTGGVLHIYTGSTTVSPPLYYGGFAIVSANAYSAIYFNGATKFNIDRLRTFGGFLGGFLLQANGQDNADINLTDCEVLYCGINSGFRIRSGSTTWANRRIALTRPVADMKTDATENEGTASRIGGNDGIGVTHTWNDITITDPTITRFRHSGINVYDEGAYVPGNLTLTAGSAYGVFDSTQIEYGRAMSVAGSHANNNVKISGVKSTGQVTRSQFGGKCYISGNSWKNLRYDKVIAGYESSQAVWFQNWDASPGNVDMIDVVFQNNLIENPISAPIVLVNGSARAGSMLTNKIKIINNTIIDVTYFQDTRRSSATGGLGQVHSIQAYNWGAGGAVTTQIIQNNNLMTPASPGGNQVYWNTAAYAINAAPGFSGNLENVEGYVNRATGNYRPTLTGGLKGTGVVGLVGALDSDGLAFLSPPSIAPTEYVAGVIVIPPVSLPGTPIRPAGYYEPLPLSSVLSFDDLVRYMMQELYNISSAVNLARAGRIEISYKPPTKLEEGLLALADGVAWNPGAGPGMYIYYGGVWNRLG